MVSREEAIAELKARGIDPSSPPPHSSTATISREEAIAELKRRGVNVPETTISQEHPVRRMISQMAHQGLDLGGMIGGGMAGGGLGALSIPVTGPIGPAGGAVVGAGLGYAALHPLGNVFDKMIGEPTQLPSAGQAVANMPEDITTGMAGEMGGRALTAAASPIAETFAQTYKPDIVALGKELKVPLSLAAKTGSEALARLQYTLRSMPFGGGAIKAQENATTDALQGVLQKVMGTAATADQAPFVGNKVIGAIQDASQIPANAAQAEATNILPEQSQAPVSVGKMGIKDIQESSRKHKSLVDLLYGEAQRIAGSQKNPLPAGTEMADQLHSELKDAVGTNSQLMNFINQIKTQPPLPTAAADAPIEKQFLGNPVLEEKIRQAAGMGPKPSSEPVKPTLKFQSLKATIDNLKDLASGENKAINSNAPGMAYQTSATGRNALRLAGALEQDLHSFGGNEGELAETLTAAKTLAKRGYEKYNSDVLALAKANPEEFVDKAIVPGNVTDTKNVLSILSPETKGAVKDSLTSKLFDVEKNGISREAVAKNLAKYGDTLNEIYSKSELQAMRDFASERSDLIADHPVFKRFLSETANTDPAAIVDYVMKPNFGKSVTQIKSVIGEENATELENQVLLKMSSNKEGDFSPFSFANAVDKMKPDTYNALFQGEKRALADKLYTLSDAVRKSGQVAANQSGTSNASMFRQLLRMAIFAPAKAAAFVGVGAGGAHAYTSELASQILGSPITSAIAKTAPSLAGAGGRIATTQGMQALIGQLKQKYEQRRKM